MGLDFASVENKCNGTCNKLSLRQFGYRDTP